MAPKRSPLLQGRRKARKAVEKDTKAEEVDKLVSTNCSIEERVNSSFVLGC